MSAPPLSPKIYHITHVDSLPRIVAEGWLVSDAEMIRRGGPTVMIGMSKIKKRRVEELVVGCHPMTKVGDYVPFYFCPRSIMLYLIHRANHPELTYRGGQDPIIHLEADLHRVVQWADTNSVKWAFSPSNGGAYYTQSQFRKDLRQLDQLDWDAIDATDWVQKQEQKQAEFLVHEWFPFSLVDRIGVRTRATELSVEAALASLAKAPTIRVEQAWYY
jgi:hypothetical protein